MKYLSEFFFSFLRLSAEMAPWLLLGFLIAGILKVYVPQHWLNKHLGKKNFRSVINGALIGVPLPLCSCGVIPTGVSLKKNGASDGSTLSFLISTPQTGVDSIMITYSLLGWPFALLRPIVAFVTGIFGGSLANLCKGSEPAPALNKIETAELSAMESESARFIAMLRYAFVDFMGDIVKWLLIGLLLAALMDVLIPDGFIDQYLGNPWLEMLFALAISIPIYICATGSVPMAAVLMLKGLSPGAALVLLMAGPATNMATITVVKKTMGTKNLLIYLFAITSGALFFGSIINYLLPQNYTQLFIQSESTHHIHDGMEWFSLISVIVLFIFMFYSLLMKIFPLKKKVTPSVQDKYEIKVEGMTCQHCEANVVRNLSSIPGLKDVQADRNSNSVQFNSSKDPDYSEIEKMIQSIGYKYKGKE